jgi:tetratricopeptide (TPR) repeat protein
MEAHSPAARIAACLGFVVPGAGHVILGRSARGLWLFFWTCFFANAALIAPLFHVWGGRIDRRGCLVGAVLIWLYSVLDLLRLLVWRHRKKIQEKKREKLLSAFGFYLRGEYARSRGRLKQVLQMDRDDVDAHFHMGMVYKREGMPRLARKHFKLSLSLDPRRKWEEEVKRELLNA